MKATAPDLTPGYPSKGPRMGPAWSDLWAMLTKSGPDFLDGREAAVAVAARRKMSPDSLVAMLARARTAGLLESEIRRVQGSRGPRSRAHYRINPTLPQLHRDRGPVPYVSQDRTAVWRRADSHVQ